MLNRNQIRPQQTFGRGFFSGLLTGVFLSTLFFFVVIGVIVIAFPATGWTMPQENVAKAKIETRAIGDIRRDMEAFIKRSKNADGPDEKAEAAVELCILHHQIVTDPRFGQADRLTSFRAITATRLKKIKKEIELVLKRQARAEKKSKRSKHAAASETHQQKIQAKADAASGEMTFETYHEIVAGEVESMSQFTGGPLRLWSYAGGAQCDYGPDLVDLITNTIDPDFWESNGGEGVIEYYQPLRIIVVGGTTQVQNDITDMLRLLRRMSR